MKLMLNARGGHSYRLQQVDAWNDKITLIVTLGEGSKALSCVYVGGAWERPNILTDILAHMRAMAAMLLVTVTRVAFARSSGRASRRRSGLVM